MTAPRRSVRRWTVVAAWLLLGGAAAWLAKMAVIVATDGRVIASGPAAWLMRAGLIGLLAGSTGVGLWLARRRPAPWRAAAAALSPATLVVGVPWLAAHVTAAVGTRGPWYLPHELPGVLVAVAALGAGATLLRQARRGTRAA